MSHSKPSSAGRPPNCVSFIVPALNEAALLTRLLDSIEALEQTAEVGVRETIVVDAASTDGTAEIARSRGCTVLEATPGCVAASRNMGASSASGDILAFVDADCELPHDWLIAVSEQLQQEGVVAAAAVMTMTPSAFTWVEAGWFELAYRRHADVGTEDVSWLATFNLAVKRSVFERTGGFDELFTTCEDVEFGYRLSSHGILRRINSCGVIHHGESKTLREFYRREAWRARGALGLMSNQWKNPREVASFLLPLVIICGLLSSLAMLLAGLTLFDRSAMAPWLIVAVAIGPLPVVLLLLRRRIRAARFIPCGFLLLVYFLARFHGTVRSSKRVERA